MKRSYLLAVVAATAATGCVSTSLQPGPEGYAAEVRRTAYGVPHITANDYAGIGYGIGYASAEDNICELADRMLTINGERARYLGPGANNANVISDAYHRRLIASGGLEALLDGPAGSPDTPSEDARDMARGFVAGVSRYVRESADDIDDPRCAGAAWVREIDEMDYWRNVYAGQNPIQLDGVVAAAPPDGPGPQAAIEGDPWTDLSYGLGSNAYGLGREVTKGGQGVLLGNPHYPWDGKNRFYRMHFVIPGELNIVGAGLMNTPIVGIGHTEHIAWSHTVSTALRFGLFELTLDPADPTRYRYEDEWVAMERNEVPVEVLTDGGIETVIHTFYETQYGPILETEAAPWTVESAYALTNVPQGIRSMDQYLGIWQAESVRELRDVLGQYQATQFNTTATDSSGEALFGDLGMIPNVTAELIAECATSPRAQALWAQYRLPVLDGSRAECAWGDDPDATAPGVFAIADQPHQFRTDYVIQSNDSHWLTNPEEPLEGYSPVFGDERTARSLRTRLALAQIADRVGGTDGYEGEGFDLTTLQQVIYGDRHLGAELVRDDLVELCRASGRADLAEACDALAGWDLRVNRDSRGAHLFRMFAEAGGLVFADPFDVNDPVYTPHTLDVSNPAALDALEAAVARLNELSIPLDAAFGDVQVETRGQDRIPIHGGAGQEGVFNVISSVSLEPELGWTSVRHGSSWIMTVEFTPDGPVSEGILTYSQSTNPNSPHFSDQTWLYSEKGWDDLLFEPEAVEAATVSRVMLRE
ncbi:MAG: penicillin acylase family protein [Maricaulaceae bacterium]|jgi:acyl-homoserine-lactone acylase